MKSDKAIKCKQKRLHRKRFFMFDINSFKGIPTGKIIAYELKKRNISQRKFAESINIHNQTLNAIIKGHRQIPLEISLKIEKELGMPEGYLLTLQLYNSIEEYKRTKTKKDSLPLPNIRKILFWDTNFEEIDWKNQRKAIIQRVKQRGNSQEKKEIASYYNIPIETL